MSREGFDAKTPDELDQEIDGFFELEGRHLVRFLGVVRAYHTRRLFADDGMPDMATWLTMRRGIEPKLARVYVRVARSLATLPLIEEALGNGSLSFSQVALVTTVATPESEEQLIAFAERATWEQLKARCAAGAISPRRRGTYGNGEAFGPSSPETEKRSASRCEGRRLSA